MVLETMNCPKQVMPVGRASTEQVPVEFDERAALPRKCQALSRKCPGN